MVVAWAALGAVLLTSNPAAADEATATVKGVVTLQGKPVPKGRIIFHLANDQFVGAKLNKDGQYTVDRVPVGQHKVTVEGEGVPAQYGTDEKTPLRVEINKGNNTIDVQLK
jgi:hypothetical protein